MSNYSVAKAFCNLVNRDWQPEPAIECARTWALEQSELGWTQLTQKDADAAVDVDCAIEGGQLYLSSRYGCYPQIFKILAEQSKDRTVYCLAGNAGPEILQTTGRLTQLAGCAIEFVPISSSTIRMLRKKMSAGHSAVLLFDVPFRNEARTRDIAIATELGEFHATSAMVRLPGLFDRVFGGLICERQEGRDRVRRLNGEDIPQIVREFAAIVKNRPSHYEQLPDLHRHWSSTDAADVGALFEHDGGKLLLHSRDMRIWKMPERICESIGMSASGSSEICKSLSERLGVRINGIYAL